MTGNLPAELSLKDRIAHALAHPEELHPATARAIANVPAIRSRQAMLARLHRIVAARSTSISPEMAWALPLGLLTIDQAEDVRRTIEATWQTAPSRNSHIATVRSIVRAAWEQGSIDAEQRDRVLQALKPWPDLTPEQATGRHISPREIARTFTVLAADGSPLAIRDGALIALMLGCGPRRSEVVGIDLEDWDRNANRLTLWVTKGGRSRVVYPPDGTVTWLDNWVNVRGTEPGPLFLPLGYGKDRQGTRMRRLSTGAVALVIAQRFGDDVTPHDLRRTFIGTALDAGADLSAVQKLAGHAKADTTAGYDRRPEEAKRAANALVQIPTAREEEA